MSLFQLCEYIFVQNNIFSKWKKANSTSPDPTLLTQNKPQPRVTRVFESQPVEPAVSLVAEPSPGVLQVSLPRALGPRPGKEGAPAELSWTLG